MKKPLFLAFLSLVAISSSGCFINMTAMTKINDDGSGFRITTYTADGAAEKEEVLKYYILPPGGEWRLNQYVKDSPPQHIYEAKQAFTDVNKLAPDYYRKGAKPGDASDNKFSLKINRGILFTTYEYEETYKDCTDSARIRKLCDSWYEHSIETAAAETARAFPKAIKKEKAREMLEAEYRPSYEYMAAELTTKGREAFNEKNTQFNARMAEFEKKYSAEGFSAIFAGYIISADKTSDSKAVTEKLMAVHASIDKQLSDYSTAENGANYDDAFGVYGWPLFMGYSFDISVVMPGRVTEANAGKIASNSAKWEFKNDDFLLKEFTLRAKSRKLNLAGIGILAAVLAAALLVAYKRERKDK
ncbi:MAG: hypothetical protein PHR22_01920 [Candidatus Omnitrophica bacterium]|nr:hypothetical protein [Candidatus Omnitrophota bacterium]